MFLRHWSSKVLFAPRKPNLVTKKLYSPTSFRPEEAEALTKLENRTFS